MVDSPSNSLLVAEQCFFPPFDMRRELVWQEIPHMSYWVGIRPSLRMNVGSYSSRYSE